MFLGRKCFGDGVTVDYDMLTCFHRRRQHERPRPGRHRRRDRPAADCDQGAAGEEDPVGCAEVFAGWVV